MDKSGVYLKFYLTMSKEGSNGRLKLGLFNDSNHYNFYSESEEII